MIICHQVPARLGLLGNPSDGFGGKTISCLISEYAASVCVWESPRVTLRPHRLHDPMVFASLADLHQLATRNGYYGGLRLLWATCKTFFEHCSAASVELPKRNFTLEYDTTIPRQVGLAGSSAIITAALKCLADFYEVGEEDLPKPVQPNLVLQAETEELGIKAGLQDRVVQVYGGLVYMDFSPVLMGAQGYGYYEPMDLSLLPPLYIAFTPVPSDSSRIHAPIRERFDTGDVEVAHAMKQFAALAQEGYVVLKSRDYRALAQLMNDNFDLRRRLYGEEALGAQNLEMIAIARQHGLPAKLAGSGGAVVGFYEDEGQFARVQQALREQGYVCIAATPTEAPRAVSTEVAAESWDATGQAYVEREMTYSAAANE